MRVVSCLFLVGVMTATCATGQETLPPLKDGKAPQTFAELWAGFDLQKEPLDVEVLHEWEQDGVVMKVVRYRVGIFKGKKAMMAAVYGYRGGQEVLSRQAPVGNSTAPLCKVYARPVKGSLPLFVIKDNPSGQYFITTDPYAECERESFENPFPPDDPRHKKYENRTVYRPYTQKTDWLELLGFVMPKTVANPSLGTTALSSVSGMEESFRPGEKAAVNEITVRR